MILILFLSFLQPKSIWAQEIEPQLSSYPSLILTIMNHIPRWQPSTETTAECLNSLKQKNLNPEICRLKDRLFFFNSYRSKLFFDFNVDESNGFHKINFPLTPDLKIRGLLGLHAGQVRPLVILRMGIHGNRDEYIAERFLVKILFEDLGYHVLTLESLTSHGFILSNKHVTFGGFEEGLHTFYILNQIKRGEFLWTKQISSVHLVALSMGGAGAFLTTYLDAQTNHQIMSVQMFCPLINLQENFQKLSEPSLLNAFADYWNSRRLMALKDKDPDLAELPLWKMIFDWTPRFAPSVLDWINRREYQSLLKIPDLEHKFPDLKIPLDFKSHVARSRDFFELNNFWPIFRNEKTPINIVTTAKDILVINEINSERIRHQQQPGVFNQVSFVDLQGFHCSIAEEYQWPFLVELMRRGIEGTNLNFH